MLAKFCPTFLMTMIRHETGPFYRRTSEYAASLGEQTPALSQILRERLEALCSMRVWEGLSWVHAFPNLKFEQLSTCLCSACFFIVSLDLLVQSGSSELSIRVTNFSQFLLRQVLLILSSCLFQFSDVFPAVPLWCPCRAHSLCLLSLRPLLPVWGNKQQFAQFASISHPSLTSQPDQDKTDLHLS